MEQESITCIFLEIFETVSDFSEQDQDSHHMDFFSEQFWATTSVLYYHDFVFYKKKFFLCIINNRFWKMLFLL